MKKLIIILLGNMSAVQAQEIFTNEFETLVASRLNGIVIKDPHLFSGGIGGCTDYTGFVNDFIINSPFNSDSDGDSFLDLNIMLQFKTDQPDYLVNKALQVNMIEANCPDPLFSGPCLIDQVIEADVHTATSQNNLCLEPIPGSVTGYPDPVISTSSPCFFTEATNFNLDILGINIPLEAYQQAARYQGGLVFDQGLHMGFVSESSAMNIIIPATIPFLGGSTLFDLLPGGGSCSVDDDRDIGPDGETLGWWFYFNSESDLIELH
jgi:hypothetical protein